MAQFCIGNMFTASAWTEADLILFTTNATVNERGELVMGRGIAREMRARFPTLGKTLAQVIMTRASAVTTFQHMRRNYRLFGPPYHLIVSPHWPERKLGIFQVKEKFCDMASLELIAGATIELKAWCEAHPQAKVHLNFPGIGNGKLDRAVVLPIVSQLPDQVTIWEFGPMSRNW